MEREGLDEKLARKKVIKVDKERTAYYNQFGGSAWDMRRHMISVSIQMPSVLRTLSD